MLNDDMGESQAKWVAYKPQKDEWVYNDGEPSEKAMGAFLFDYVNGVRCKQAYHLNTYGVKIC